MFVDVDFKVDELGNIVNQQLLPTFLSWWTAIGEHEKTSLNSRVAK